VATPSIVTVVPGCNPLAEIVTAVPPAVEPMLGEIASMISGGGGGGGGGVTYVNAAVNVPLSPPGLVTTTSTRPASCFGIVAVMLVLVMVVTFAERPSSVSVAGDRNPVPPMVTEIAPSVDPLAGKIDLTLKTADGGFGPLPQPSVMPATTTPTRATSVRNRFDIRAPPTWRAEGGRDSLKPT
jgi:hypothetical protein